MKILMVEDEEYIAEAVEQVLKKNKYSVDLAHDGQYGLDCALSGIYDIIVLDIMLPKMDGIAVLRALRTEGIKTPVLLLTAKGQVGDKVQGLDSGADDYLPKPFHSDELLARLRALGRRSLQLDPGGILAYGDIRLNTLTLTIARDNLEVSLTPKEAHLLELLVRRRNMITPKDLIIEKLWGYDSDAEDSHAENQMALLRRKLAAIGSGVSVHAVRGAGYMLKEGGSEK